MRKGWEVLAVAVVVGVVAFGFMGEPHRLWPSGWVLLAVGVGILVLRQRFPVLVLIATLAVMVAYYHLLGDPGGPEPLPFVFALWSATAEGHRVLAIAAAAGAAVVITVPGGSLDEVPTVVAALLVVLAAGEITRVRRAYLRQSRQRAVDAERLRIAQELHDGLVHHMSVISVQANAALLRPAHAGEALAVIKQASRDALGEVRSTVGVLRAPGVRRLDELLDRVRTEGLAVSKHIRGEAELPAEVDHALYRIVQESLTNVVRHSGATRAAVRLDYRHQDVTVRIEDNGRGSDAPPGNGLAGMRERAIALGGDFGTSNHGGFRVRARLPR